MNTMRKMGANMWRTFKHLTTFGFPRRFPIVQFPNLPLVVAIACGETSRFVPGAGHSFLLVLSILAMIVWAYEELVYGVNWFRSLLGLFYLIVTIARIFSL